MRLIKKQSEKQYSDLFQDYCKLTQELGRKESIQQSPTFDKKEIKKSELDLELVF